MLLIFFGHKGETMKRVLAVLFLACVTAFAQQPVNNTQINGSAIATSATGVQKVGIVGVAGTTLDNTSAGVLDENVKLVNGVTVLMGNGITGTGSQRVTIASDNTAFQVKILGNAGGAFDAAGQNAASPANELLVGGQFNTSPTTITSGNISPFQLDSAGKLLVNCTGCGAGATISLIPATSGGLTMGHLVAAATNNATALKGSAGQLYGASVYNNTTYPVYLKFCNKATACTCGTNSGSDTILFTLAAQAGTQREMHTEEGIAFSTGISYCAVKGMGDTDNTSLAASDAVIDLIYK